MRISFLDFDGVLNSSAHWDRSGLSPEDIHAESLLLDERGVPRDDPEYIKLMSQAFDPLAVSRLNRITTLSGAVIVLSTNWGINIPIGQLVVLLRNVGVEAPILGKTVRKYSLHERAGEIGMTIDRRQPYSFVILEDLHPMYIYEPRTIRTSMSTGLLDEHIGPAVELLARPWNEQKEILLGEEYAS